MPHDFDRWKCHSEARGATSMVACPTVSVRCPATISVKNDESDVCGAPERRERGVEEIVNSNRAYNADIALLGVPQLNNAIEELNQKARRPLSRKVLTSIAAVDPATNAAVQEMKIPGFSKRAREQYGECIASAHASVLLQASFQMLPYLGMSQVCCAEAYVCGPEGLFQRAL